MKKIAIVYVSLHHKNTEKVVNVISDELNADIFDIKNARNVDFSPYDMIGFASGIFYGAVHKSLDRFINEGKNLPKDAFIILTSGVKAKRYPKNFSASLKEKGYNVLDAFHCKGYDTFSLFKYIGGIAKGHPNETDLSEASKFARKLKTI